MWRRMGQRVSRGMGAKGVVGVVEKDLEIDGGKGCGGRWRQRM